MGYVPDRRMIKRTADKTYYGVYIGYGGNDMGCALIEAYAFPEVREEEDDEPIGTRVAEWVGLSHEEAWRQIYAWVDETEKRGGFTTPPAA